MFIAIIMNSGLMAVIIENDTRPVRATRKALKRMRKDELPKPIRKNFWLKEWREFVSMRGINIERVAERVRNLKKPKN